MADYQVKLLHTEDCKTTEWSGGTTTELAIAPKESTYADRNFLWRLSSATVAMEESTFTSLPDYDRIIMTLRGEIQLSHNGDNWIDLAEYTPHTFDGADETVSVGKVVDFNLMLKKSRCAGLVLPFRMMQGEHCDIRSVLAFEMPEYEEVMIYCDKGILAVTLEDGTRLEVGVGDTLWLSGDFSKAVWTCDAVASMAAVIAAVHYL